MAGAFFVSLMTLRLLALRNRKNVMTITAIGCEPT
jgi:hypothetical protein